MSTVKAVLVSAKELIKKGWTQGSGARDAQMHPCNDTHENAVCYCALGALNRAEHEAGKATFNRYEIAYGLLNNEVRKRTKQGSILAYNDASERTVEDVLSLFDAAIMKAPQETTE